MEWETVEAIADHKRGHSQTKIEQLIWCVSGSLLERSKVPVVEMPQHNPLAGDLRAVACSPRENFLGAGHKGRRLGRKE